MRLMVATGALSPRERGWVGHSAGGTLAMLLLLLGRIPGPVVALAPVADLARAATEKLGDEAVSAWMGGLPGVVAAYARLDPAVVLRRDGFPDAGLTVMHPAEDGTVPVAHRRDLGFPATIVSGASHFDVVDPESPHVEVVLAALEDALADAGDSSMSGEKPHHTDSLADQVEEA